MFFVKKLQSGEKTIRELFSWLTPPWHASSVGINKPPTRTKKIYPDMPLLHAIHEQADQPTISEEQVDLIADNDEPIVVPTPLDRRVPESSHEVPMPLDRRGTGREEPMSLVSNREAESVPTQMDEVKVAQAPLVICEEPPVIQEANIVTDVPVAKAPVALPAVPSVASEAKVVGEISPASAAELPTVAAPPESPLVVQVVAEPDLTTSPTPSTEVASPNTATTTLFPETLGELETSLPAPTASDLATAKPSAAPVVEEPKAAIVAENKAIEPTSTTAIEEKIAEAKKETLPDPLVSRIQSPADYPETFDYLTFADDQSLETKGYRIAGRCQPRAELPALRFSDHTQRAWGSIIFWIAVILAVGGAVYSGLLKK